MVPLGHVVKEYMIGKTKVRICDDAYRDKTPEEIQAQLDRVSLVAQRALEAQAWRKSREQASNG